MEQAMKTIPLFILILLTSCVADKKNSAGPEDAALIEQEIDGYHKGLKRAYNGASISTDSLINSFFDKDVYYVTYWGDTEPINATKSRLRNALSAIKDYDNRIESLNVKVYGDGAYAFFILRQTYTLNGVPMDEYLPTTFILERRDKRWVVVHSHRSTDVQTIQQYMDVSQRHETQASSQGEK
jgi:hypothetical protein